MSNRNEIAPALRGIGDAIRDSGVKAQFVQNDCPFVDRACEAIEQGGHVDATSLASLVEYLADMLSR